MQKAVSTFVYVKERLHPGLLDGLLRGGAQAIEIFAARQHIDYANRKQHVREIADWFRSTGIPLNSVHSPLYGDYNSSAPAHRRRLHRPRRPHRGHGRIKRALKESPAVDQVPDPAPGRDQILDERKLEAA
jgi:hypothetical protein